MSISREDTIEILQHLFDWKYNSVATYILEAQAFVAKGQEGLVEILRTISAEDQKLSDEIAEAMRELKAVPHVHPYEQSIAELNYLSINFLCKKLDEEISKEESYVMEQLSKIPAGDTLHALLLRILDSAKRQRERIASAS